jgi:CheY-like chemotaxis protein
VLIVDDNATSRQVLEEFFGNIGMRPFGAASAREAMDELQKSQSSGDPISIAVVDAGMPDVDGFSLAANIRNDERLDCAIIMMMTGRYLLDESLRSAESGIAAYLTKPLKESELRDAILRALGEPSARAAHAAPVHATSAGPHRPLRILLAEDSLINQKLAAGQLTKAGHQVVVVNNGIDAVAAVATEEYDVVLMDIQMPVMDGLQAAAAIRQREVQTGRRTPIIAMTAHVTQDDRDKCLAAGMDGYIGKPVRSADLQHALDEAVSTSRHSTTT